MLDVTFCVCISLIAIFSLALTVIGMPGNWLMVVVSAAMTFYFDSTRIYAMHLWTFIAIIAIASLGEVVEFVSGAAGVSKLGGSKRSAALAIFGSMIGAIVGLFVGTPVPVFGSIIVSILLGGVGAFAGAVLGERWVGREWEDAIAVGKAAFWGRFAGTIGKVICGTTMTCVLIAAAWIDFDFFNDLAT